MTDDAMEPLEHPDEIQTPEGERHDGRPAETDDADIGPNGPKGDLPTVAPEERGGTPSTEHAPGADL